MPKKHLRRARNSSRKSWQGVKLSNKMKRRLRVVSMAVMVVIATVVVFGAVVVWQYLRTPFAAASGDTSVNFDFTSERRYNMLIILLDDKEDNVSLITSLGILSLDPQRHSASYLALPVDSEMQLAGSSQMLKTANIYALGEVGEERDNLSLLKRTVAGSLAVPIDNYFLTDSEGLAEFEEHLGQQVSWDNFGSLFSYRNLTKITGVLRLSRDHLRTDSTLIDTTNLAKYLIGVRSDKQDKLAITPELLADVELLDTKLQPFVVDKKLFEERLSVQILNGTPVAGLATLTGRYVKNMGGRVVGVGNTDYPSHEKSFILARDVQAYSVLRLAELFGITEIREYDSAYGIRNRADISVVIGLDIAGSL